MIGGLNYWYLLKRVWVLFEIVYFCDCFVVFVFYWLLDFVCFGLSVWVLWVAYFLLVGLTLFEYCLITNYLLCLSFRLFLIVLFKLLFVPLCCEFVFCLMFLIGCFVSDWNMVVGLCGVLIVVLRAFCLLLVLCLFYLMRYAWFVIVKFAWFDLLVYL